MMHWTSAVSKRARESQGRDWMTSASNTPPLPPLPSQEHAATCCCGSQGSSIRPSTSPFLPASPTCTLIPSTTPTSFCAISCNRRGRRRTLWLMALRLMCRGRVWKTSELEDFWVTAFSIALISAARAWAKVEAVEDKQRIAENKSWIHVVLLGGFQKGARLEVQKLASPPPPQTLLEECQRQFWLSCNTTQILSAEQFNFPARIQAYLL